MADPAGYPSQDELDEELDMGQDSTLYDTYNAATRALMHADGISTEQQNRGLEDAARLLDRYSDIPDADTLGRTAVERRVEAYTAEDEVEPYWADEEETLHTLLQAHGDAI